MKDEYRLLNEVQIDISKYEEEKVDELEKKRMMKRFMSSNKKKRRINNKKVVAVAAVLFIIVNLGINRENVSAAVESFNHNISSWLGVEKIKNNYSVEIGETIKEGGIEVTLNEFFTDNDRIIINLETNKKIQALSDDYKDLIPDIYVNGEQVDIDLSYVGYSIGQVKDKDTETQDGSNVILEIGSKGLNLSKEENVKLVFSTLSKKNGIDEAKFSYDFVYDINNYMKDCKVVDVNKKINIDGNSLQVDKVIVSPDRIIILGNENGFYPWTNEKNIKYFYDIVDQNNELVGLKAAIGEGAFFYKGDKETTSLKIVPYTFEAIDTKNIKIDEEGRTKYIMEDSAILINLK